MNIIFERNISLIKNGMFALWEYKFVFEVYNSSFLYPN